MGKTTGGSLLCVDDLMHDLLEEPTSTQPLSTPSHTSGLEAMAATSESLEVAFQRTYKELELALASSGHSWTSLTQQLYSALMSANQVVVAADSNLESLAEKAARLKSVLERGDAVMRDLQAAVTQLQIERLSAINQ